MLTPGTYGAGPYGAGPYGGFVTVFIGVVTENAPHYHPIMKKHDPVLAGTDVVLGLVVLVAVGRRVLCRLVSTGG
jgi:hypothetical protein